MSERSQVVPTPEGEYFEGNRFAGLSMIAGAVAAIALVLCVIGAFVAPKQFSYSWLWAFGYFFTLCAGCYFWVIVHHAVDAEWSVVIRRQMENIACLFPLLALFFIPIFLLREHLWEWMTIPPHVDHLMDSKRAYLNVPFFAIRAVIILAYFGAFAWIYRNISVRQDRDGNPAYTLTMRKLSFVALPLFALSLTFGAFDWMMSLDYIWFSTLYGVYVFAGAAGSSMSLLVLLVTWLRKQGYLKEIVSIEHYHFMGKWMLAFTVFWAYIGFSQYMLIWYANIPEETQYFILRNTESWNLASILLMGGRFFLPFLLLLLRSTKKNVSLLCKVAAWILFMQALDIYVIILPELHRTGVHISIWDFVAWIAIAASMVFLYLRIVGSKASLFPVRDPRLLESLRIQN
jgi:hypothetical protein